MLNPLRDRWDFPLKTRILPDSPLEGDGFELSVPGRETVKPSWETGLLSRKRERICWGTEGSNPPPPAASQRRTRPESTRQTEGEAAGERGGRRGSRAM